MSSETNCWKADRLRFSKEEENEFKSHLTWRVRSRKSQQWTFWLFQKYNTLDIRPNIKYFSLPYLTFCPLACFLSCFCTKHNSTAVSCDNCWKLDIVASRDGKNLFEARAKMLRFLNSCPCPYYLKLLHNFLYI